MATRLTRLPRTLTHLRPSQSLLTTRMRQRQASTSNFQNYPSPPRLSPEEQAEFERLQRTANTQEGFNATSTPDFTIATTPSSSSTNSSTISSGAQPETPALSSNANTNGEANTAMSTPLRKGAPPEFEGEVNPRTGEVGGPKNEPLRWGAKGDYSFNGRVTDF
ncbi:hypothetical protein F5Y03DRAFT_380549 [Xylaria venustula]|nr:hypothetical protein F5Y03DRAFT_380549 [Xylaria venustula]